MARIFSRIPIPLVTIAVCAFFASKAASQFIASQIGTPPRTSTSHPSPPVGAMAGPNTRDIGSILQRNIFCSTCQPAVVSDEPAPGEPAGTSDAPVKSTAGHQLLATLISHENAGLSYAVIVKSGSENATVYTIGADLGEGAVVAEIMDRVVLLKRGGRYEYLEMGAEDTPGDTVASTEGASPGTRHAPGLHLPTPLDGFESLAKGITRVSGDKYQIDRRAINQVLANPAAFARGSRIIPYTKAGKPAGFRVFGRRGGLISLLGLFGGDVVTAINGHPITTPDKALEVLSSMRNASYLNLSFERRGQPLTHEYVIR